VRRFRDRRLGPGGQGKLVDDYPYPLAVFADTPSAIIAPVRFTVTIEGTGWTDVQQLELPRLPREGELIETKYGTCQVTHSEATPEAEPVAGKIVCSIS
jgi:hypothetical protein